MFVEDPHRRLASALLEDHMIPTAGWLLGKAAPPSDYLLPQAANSNWECALAAWYLIDLYGALPSDHTLRVAIQEKVPATILWMLDQALVETPGTSWEHVTWDTAICIRSVLRAARTFPDAFSPENTLRIDATAEGALVWMFDRFSCWRDDVLYPFGPADVAQICEATVYVAGVNRRLADRAVHLADGGSIEAILERMVVYLIAEGQPKTLATNAAAEAEHRQFLGDVFQASEVAEALVGYMAFRASPRLPSMFRHTFRRRLLPLRRQYQPPSGGDLVSRCHLVVIGVLHYLEDHQADGRWGGHAETCRSMQAYLRCSTSVSAIGPQPQVILKGIRWMCDAKQAFVDGSFLHTSYATVFYALALWHVYTSWPLAEDSVIRVYDRALWATAVQTSAERGRRLELELQAERLLYEAGRQRRRYEVLRRRVQGLTGVVLATLAAVSVANLVGLVHIRSPEVTTTGDIGGYLVLLAALGVAAGGAWYRRDGD